MAVTDALRAQVRDELPEVQEIGDATLQAAVVEAWATALDRSSFASISEIRPSGNPDTPPLKQGSQADHIRGVTRLALAMAEQLGKLDLGFQFNRDVLIAGALCHDVGKPWEFDPANQARWKASPGAAGWPSIRHPAYGVHICLSVGLPEEVAHMAGAHSGEGELLVRSLENTILHHADHAFWRIISAAGLLAED